mmetsp:Transcript_84221/g.238640  ORF Transcript_84221/g.238640 Transcript_84221/m.238640 type:complete len:133 (+) Transcript_84221:1932-2330(+)
MQCAHKDQDLPQPLGGGQRCTQWAAGQARARLTRRYAREKLRSCSCAGGWTTRAAFQDAAGGGERWAQRAKGTSACRFIRLHLQSACQPRRFGWPWCGHKQRDGPEGPELLGQESEKAGGRAAQVQWQDQTP